MTRIGITGASGFLGWHLRCRLKALGLDDSVTCIDRRSFEHEEELDRLISDREVIVHLAGANRGSDEEVEATNMRLAETLVNGLQRTGSRASIVYANSTHRDRDSPYGRSKLRVGSILAAWGASAGTSVADLVFPNLFGEMGRPHYNSAVATFCHQISHGEESAVNLHGATELLHAQEAAQLIVGAISKRTNGVEMYPGTRMSTIDLYDRLRTLADSYHAQFFPNLRDELDRQLFNTLRSYLFTFRDLEPLLVHSDERGSFCEIARGHGATQVSFATTRPGVTRGDHYHMNKIERFTVLSGLATIRVRRLFDSRVDIIRVSAQVPQAVDMPTLHTHNITNIGDADLLTAFWANDHFDPDHPDTYQEPVDS